MAAQGGTVAAVTPQNWLFLGSYKKMREALLAQASFVFVGALGPRCFETISGEVVNAALVALTEARPDANTVLAGLDANDAPDPAGKAAALVGGEVRLPRQAAQRGIRDLTINVFEYQEGDRLLRFASAHQGISSGDKPHFVRCFWEVSSRSAWHLFQDAGASGAICNGMHNIIALHHLNNSGAGAIRGREAWTKTGIAVSVMRSLNRSAYFGSLFADTLSVIVPRNPVDLLPIYTFVTDTGFPDVVRQVDQALSVTDSSFTKVPFDLAHWQKIAAEKYPNGLPEPYSDDPTQWLFHGHPRYAEAGTELHVALARLAGYRWPAETDTEMRLSAEARARIAEAATPPETDADGLARPGSRARRAPARRAAARLLRRRLGRCLADGHRSRADRRRLRAREGQAAEAAHIGVPGCAAMPRASTPSCSTIGRFCGGSPMAAPMASPPSPTTTA